MSAEQIRLDSMASMILGIADDVLTDSDDRFLHLKVRMAVRMIPEDVRERLEHSHRNDLALCLAEGLPRAAALHERIGKILAQARKGKEAA